MTEEMPFRVGWSPSARRALEEIAIQGGTAERARQLAIVVRAVDYRLRLDPLSLGEVYRIRGPVVEHLGVVDFLSVDFAVDQDRRYVHVRECHALSGFWN